MRGIIKAFPGVGVQRKNHIKAILAERGKLDKIEEQELKEKMGFILGEQVTKPIGGSRWGQGVRTPLENHEKKEKLEINDFEKRQKTTKSMKNHPACEELRHFYNDDVD